VAAVLFLRRRAVTKPVTQVDPEVQLQQSRALDTSAGAVSFVAVPKPLPLPSDTLPADSGAMVLPSPSETRQDAGDSRLEPAEISAIQAGLEASSRAPAAATSSNLPEEIPEEGPATSAEPAAVTASVDAEGEGARPVLPSQSVQSDSELVQTAAGGSETQ
jgi:hypothetical protein